MFDVQNKIFYTMQICKTWTHCNGGSLEYMYLVVSMHIMVALVCSTYKEIDFYGNATI